MKIALIAHDKKKQDMIYLSKKYKLLLKEIQVYGTGTTGKLVSENVGIEVHRFLSGPIGGDQQIGAKVAEGDMDAIVFLRDPLTAQPHEPDVSALLRICDVHCIPLATNMGSAEVLLKAIARKLNIEV